MNTLAIYICANQLLIFLWPEPV